LDESHTNLKDKYFKRNLKTEGDDLPTKHWIDLNKPLNIKTKKTNYTFKTQRYIHEVTNPDNNPKSNFR